MKKPLITAQTQPMTPATMLRNKYNSGRNNILLLIIFTLINIFSIVVAKSTSCFLFSITLPYILTSYAMLFTGSFPAEYYEKFAEDFKGFEFLDKSILTVALVFSFIIIAVYALCFFLSKKHVGWLITAACLFTVDTLILFGFIAVSGGIFSGLIDLAFHALGLMLLYSGVYNYFKLKKLNESVICADFTVKQDTGIKESCEAEAEANTETKTAEDITNEYK